MGGGGFNAVPEELQRAANVITDTVGQAAKLVWQGPSGNYGHPGVQGGWDQFVADAKAEINRLAQAAKGHRREPGERRPRLPGIRSAGR